MDLTKMTVEQLEAQVAKPGENFGVRFDDYLNAIETITLDGVTPAEFKTQQNAIETELRSRFPKRDLFSHRNDHHWQELVDGTWQSGTCAPGDCLKNKARAPWARTN